MTINMRQLMHRRPKLNFPMYGPNEVPEDGTVIVLAGVSSQQQARLLISQGIELS
jgi:hypothetical protein